VSLAWWGIATNEIRTTNIKLNPEQEKTIKDELQSGHFRNVEEVIAEALQALREKERLPSPSRRNGEQRDAVREMLAFAERNHARLDAVSVKELIHEGRRLRVISCWMRPWPFRGFWKTKQTGNAALMSSPISPRNAPSFRSSAVTKWATGFCWPTAASEFHSIKWRDF
jgi:Arc/MetJ-type ribon-helix-helix transcriptional regulator